MACFLVASLILFVGISLIGEVHPKIVKRDVMEFLKREKCIPDLGCFKASSPFFDIVERPISLLPDDRESINTRFLLYTPDYPHTPFNFSNIGPSLDYLPRSDFNPDVNTKFLIPGFISGIAPNWKMPLKDALLMSEHCNVFLVDWTGGDGPWYEQAVANTRVVGAEIALLIQRLQERTGIKPESVHLIGHSLGSHIAGYAGKRITNLGRITAMDPAGPYFTKVDPIVRLDRADALFVDAIHTNAAPSRFQGFGLPESIGHFDFYPNGGHLQPGCHDMGEAIWSFLKHPTIDEKGMHEIMCNHGRSIDLFISSLNHRECEMKGISCESWDKFVAGKCGSCDVPEKCVPLGIHAVQFASRINVSSSINLYLNTTASEPFCNK